MDFQVIPVSGFGTVSANGTRSSESVLEDTEPCLKDSLLETFKISFLLRKLSDSSSWLSGGKITFEYCS